MPGAWRRTALVRKRICWMMHTPEGRRCVVHNSGGTQVYLIIHAPRAWYPQGRPPTTGALPPLLVATSRIVRGFSSEISSEVHCAIDLALKTGNVPATISQHPAPHSASGKFRLKWSPRNDVVETKSAIACVSALSIASAAAAEEWIDALSPLVLCMLIGALGF